MGILSPQIISGGGQSIAVSVGQTVEEGYHQSQYKTSQRRISPCGEAESQATCPIIVKVKINQFALILLRNIEVPSSAS